MNTTFTPIECLTAEAAVAIEEIAASDDDSGWTTKRSGGFPWKPKRITVSRGVDPRKPVHCAVHGTYGDLHKFKKHWYNRHPGEWTTIDVVETDSEATVEDTDPVGHTATTSEKKRKSDFEDDAPPKYRTTSDTSTTAPPLPIVPQPPPVTVPPPSLPVSTDQPPLSPANVFSSVITIADRETEKNAPFVDPPLPSKTPERTCAQEDPLLVAKLAAPPTPMQRIERFALDFMHVYKTYQEQKQSDINLLSNAASMTSEQLDLLIRAARERDATLTSRMETADRAANTLQREARHMTQHYSAKQTTNRANLGTLVLEKDKRARAEKANGKK